MHQAGGIHIDEANSSVHVFYLDAVVESICCSLQKEAWFLLDAACPCSVQVIGPSRLGS